MLAGSRARIGFHQTATVGRQRRCDQSMDDPAVVKVRRYLRFAITAYADQIFQTITKTSCDSIAWIYGQRALELGVATTLESEGIDVFGPEASRRWIK